MEPRFGPRNKFMLIFKSEARISKPETNSKFEMMNDQNNKKILILFHPNDCELR